MWLLVLVVPVAVFFEKINDLTWQFVPTKRSIFSFL